MGEGEGIRCSKDKKLGNGGKRLINLVEDIGGYILNGTQIGDEEGEFTYIGSKGSTVIDYVIVNDNYIDLVNSFKVGERVDSDHMPLCLELNEAEIQREEENKRRESDKEERGRLITRWDKVARARYKENTEKGERIQLNTLEVEEAWQRLKKKIKEALVNKERKVITKELGHKDWWDKDCTRMKRKVHRQLKKWKKGKLERVKFINAKMEFEALRKEKRKRKRKDEEEELKERSRDLEIHQ